MRKLGSQGDYVAIIEKMGESGMDYAMLAIDIEEAQNNKELLLYHDECDRYDYLIAVGCGVVGGLVDIFLAGTPGNSILGSRVDKQVDSAIRKFAKLSGWLPREGKENNVASAIGFLEKKFKINYDQRHTADVGNVFNMTTRNHHIMSLAHSPDIVGLFFSILGQFTSTSAFVSGGQVIILKTETFELQGGNLIAKLFCGIANWFGHIMSDIAGSSGSRENSGRGSGVAIPFYEMLQFCKFGELNIGKDKQDFATIAIRVFQEGYDFRFGVAVATPIIVTELLIELIWSLRRYFQYKLPLYKCVPTSRYDNLRLMILIGNGTLCVMDGFDAAIESGGNILSFLTRCNIIGWFRLVRLVLKEICIRLDITDAAEYNIESIKRINVAIEGHLAQIEKLDIERFDKETRQYNELNSLLESVNSESELKRVLSQIYIEKGYAIPWGENFEVHMSDSKKHLLFE